MGAAIQGAALVYRPQKDPKKGRKINLVVTLGGPCRLGAAGDVFW